MKDGSTDFRAGGNLGGGSDDHRIGLSPFAAWTIELPPKYNAGLDLSGLTEITITFTGRASALKPEHKNLRRGRGKQGVTQRPIAYAVL